LPDDRRWSLNDTIEEYLLFCGASYVKCTFRTSKYQSTLMSIYQRCILTMVSVNNDIHASLHGQNLDE